MFISLLSTEASPSSRLRCADLAACFTDHVQGFAVVDTMDTPDIKLFGKWSTDVSVSDSTLEVRLLKALSLRAAYGMAVICCAILTG